ncbi:hypothetical protein [Planococcus lenghuensis]|uniref:hypothetical protein n=1 Tax=Planococcus lenghuensis TaxID=2213202 RepID=UPI0012EB4E24|nr:hypothetical protein [Planococcus lenghuensis]
MEFETLKQLSCLSQYVPQPLEFGDTFMVFSYLPDKDAEEALNQLSMDVLQDHKHFTEIVPSWYPKNYTIDAIN